MRVVLVTAAFRARSPFDLRSHVRSLAPALARSGAAVEVFCAARGSGLAPLAQRRTEVIDHVGGTSFGVTALEVGGDVRGTGAGAGAIDEDRIASAFGDFLDRERPDVVHIEQLDAFGAGLVREIRARGIGSVYFARDTWPAHDRRTQTLPDLTPFELGDQEAEARALLAEEDLGPVPATGRFGDAAKDQRLCELLHEPLTAMNDVLRMRDARERVELRRAMKRVALSGVDRRFATSRLLAKELSAAVGRAFTFRAAGVDTSLFHASTVPAERGGPVRYVFVGTSAPTSGIDVLFDALAEARRQDDAPAMALTLYLETDEPARDSEVAERAELLRVETRWTRGPVDVVGALAAADVVVMPSLWGEVSPALIRVALAAGRPMIASRMPGVVESLPSSAARFVGPGEVTDLRAELVRLARDGDQLTALLRGAADAARSTKSTDDEAREWIDTYEQIVAEGGARRSGSTAPAMGQFSPPRAAPSKTRLPAHVEDVARAFAELESLSVAELFARAQEGVGKLRKAFGLKDSSEDLMRRVVARGGDARDRAGQLALMRAEIQESLDGLRRARALMQREESERAARVADLHAILGQYEREVQSRGEEAARAVKDLREATATAESLAANVETLEAGVTSLTGSVETLESGLGALEKENRELAERAERLAAEKDGLVGEREALEEARRALETSIATEKSALEATLASEKRALETKRRAAAKELDAAKARFQALAKEAELARAALAEAEAERARFEATLGERDELVAALRERIGAPDVTADSEGAAAASGDASGDADAPRRRSARSGSGAPGLAALERDLDSIEAFCVALEQDARTLERHDAWLREESTRLLAALEEAADARAVSTDPGDERAAFERGFALLATLRSELDWRRSEMEAARLASSSLRAKVLAGPLAARVRDWDGAARRYRNVPDDRREVPVVKEAAAPVGGPVEGPVDGQLDGQLDGPVGADGDADAGAVDADREDASAQGPAPKVVSGEAPSAPLPKPTAGAAGEASTDDDDDPSDAATSVAGENDIRAREPRAQER